MTLRTKLILTHTLVAVLAIVLVTVIANAAISRYFTALANSQAKTLATEMSSVLQDCYSREGRWIANIRRCFRVADGQLPLRQQLNNRRVILADPQGRILFDSEDRAIARLNNQATGTQQAANVVVAGATVGIVYVQPIEGQLGKAEDQFLKIVRRSITLAGLTAGVAALIVGWLLAQNLTRSLRGLTAAAHQLARGDRQVAVPRLTSHDEVAELSNAFNTLSNELQRSEESRRSMVADIAHELRTPLSVLKLELESIQDGVTPPTPAVINSLSEEVDLLNRLIGDLRTLSLADAGQLSLHMQPVALNDEIERVVGRLASAAREKTITVQTHCTPNLPLVSADVDRVQQVIGNLLHNAIRYTPDYGTVQITTHVGDNEVVIGVRDSGAGLTPEEVQAVFARFYRTDKARARETGGTGLGLAIVRGLTESMGGRVWAESIPNAGAQFWVAFPLASQAKT